MTAQTTSVRSDNPSATARFAGLDGLRALAVLMVVSHNFGPTPGLSKLGRLGWFRAGYVGVTLFFVLSGFLISQRLIAAFTSHGSVSFSRFWKRRARRLLPALGLCLTLLVANNMRTHVSPSMTFRAFAAAVFYVFNLVGIHRSPASPLGGTGWGPLWSLSVEEQFYLLWPIPLIWAWRRLGQRKTFAAVLALGCASSVWTVALWLRGASFNRLYLATDTRSQSLFIGAAIAVAWQGWPWLQQSTARYARVLAPACFVLLGLGMFGSGANPAGSPGWLLGPGLAFVTVLCAVIVVTATKIAPTALISRLLNARGTVAIGQRSYGIYLFHSVCAAYVGHQRGGWFLALLATFALSFASYQLIEQPLLRSA